MSKNDEVRHRDAALAEQLKAHHAVMVNELDRLSADLVAVAASGGAAAPAVKALEQWVSDVLIPHASEEEQTTYRAAGQLPEGRLLIEAMLAEHVLIRQTARQALSAQDSREAGAYARALSAIFESHQRKENDIILPLLVDSETVQLTSLFDQARDHHHDDEHDHHQPSR